MFHNISNTLSISKLLLGISKSLGIIKELSPIYDEIKPFIKKIPKFREKMVEYINYQNPSKIISNHKLIPDNTKKNHGSGPIFFQ